MIRDFFENVLYFLAKFLEYIDLEIAGPVGNILDEFHKDSMEGDCEMGDVHSQMENDTPFYKSHSSNIDEMIGLVERNFEDVINDQEATDHEEDNKSVNSFKNVSPQKYFDKSLSPEFNKKLSYQFSNTNTNNKVRRRDAKFINKTSTKKNSPTQSKKRITQKEGIIKNSNHESQKEHSGLIIKISSGGNLIKNERVNMTSSKSKLESNSNNNQASKPVRTKGNTESKSTKSQDCSSSISTLSNDKHEKLSRESESSIELDNSLKIVCRDIGPLKAEERKRKVLHYLNKKRSRRWRKRINYT